MSKENENTIEMKGNSDFESKAKGLQSLGLGDNDKDNDGDNEHSDDERSDNDDDGDDNDKTLAESGLLAHKPLMKHLGYISHTFESMQSEIKTQKKHMADLVHRVQHEQNAIMRRMISAVTRNHNELKSALVEELRETTAAITQNGADQRKQIRGMPKEVTETISQGQAEQAGLMRENLDNQAQLLNELKSKIADPVKEIHAGFSKLIDEISITNSQQLTLLTDNMEKALIANSKILAESMGNIMSKVCVDMTKELRGLVSTNQTIITSDNGMNGEPNPSPSRPAQTPKQLVTASTPSLPKPSKTKVTPKTIESDPDTSDNEKSDSNSMHSMSLSNTTRNRSTRRPKLPAFTGSELWEIWYNRFSDVAGRFGWTEDEKLDELLPRLQGQAGEFVYGQLSSIIRNDYSKLVAELHSRFRKVESNKTFGKKFANRQQKPGETPETYCADLKKLYDKAHPGRNVETREEDLLRRFFDGLQDGDAKVQIEFFKSPDTIDEAVALIVNYHETRSQSVNPVRPIRKNIPE
jgi:hypothetical protein